MTKPSDKQERGHRMQSEARNFRNHGEDLWLLPFWCVPHRLHFLNCQRGVQTKLCGHNMLYECATKLKCVCLGYSIISMTIIIKKRLLFKCNELCFIMFVMCTEDIQGEQNNLGLPVLFPCGQRLILSLGHSAAELVTWEQQHLVRPHKYNRRLPMFCIFKTSEQADVEILEI